MTMEKTEPAGGRAGEKLRVAILPATFDPRLNYQENTFAHALHRMGHEVVVLTTQHVAGTGAEELARLDAALPFRVIRSNRVLRIRRTHVPWDWTMRGRLREFDPQAAFVLAPNHGTGVWWMRLLPPQCRRIVGFSDMPWHRKGFSAWVKSRWARRAIRGADLVFTATAATQGLVQEWAGPEMAGKVQQVGLSFEPEPLDSGKAPPEVEVFAGRVRRLIVSVTRLAPRKRLDEVFHAAERVLQAQGDVGFVMSGFDDEPESQRVRAIIKASPVADRCLLLPLLNPGEVGGVFRLAACSVWSTVSIGIYHSLHCGCRVLVREGQDATHLLAHREAGGWFADHGHLAEALERLLEEPADRAAVSAVVAPYHSEKVLARLLEEVMQGERRAAGIGNTGA